MRGKISLVLSSLLALGILTGCSAKPAAQNDAPVTVRYDYELGEDVDYHRFFSYAANVDPFDMRAYAHDSWELYQRDGARFIAELDKEDDETIDAVCKYVDVIHHFDSNIEAQEYYDKLMQEQRAKQSALPFAQGLSFFSDDGKVEYIFSDTLGYSPIDLPMVEIKPHTITSDEVKAAAQLMFGGAKYYEYLDSSGYFPYEQSHLEDNLERWRSALTDGSIEAMYGEGTYTAKNSKEVFERFLPEYEKKIASAPETAETRSSQLEFHSESYYSGSGANPYRRSVHALALPEGSDLRYRLSAVNSDDGETKVLSVRAYLYNDISPDNYDEMWQRYRLCLSEKPTDEQLQAIVDKSLAILGTLDAAEWTVDSISSERLYYGTEKAYRVDVTALPSFNGVTVKRIDQLATVSGSAEGTQHFYFTQARFSFAPDGTLLNLSVTSPIDTVDYQEKAPVMSTEELVSAAQSYLKGMGFDIYNEFYLMFYDNVSQVKIYIDDTEYGLVRAAGANDETYTYVPTLFLDGHIEAFNSEGELIYTSAPNRDSALIRFAILSAVDGSPINVLPEPGFSRAE